MSSQRKGECEGTMARINDRRRTETRRSYRCFDCFNGCHMHSKPIDSLAWEQRRDSGKLGTTPFSPTVQLKPSSYLNSSTSVFEILTVPLDSE